MVCVCVESGRDSQFTNPPIYHHSLCNFLFFSRWRLHSKNPPYWNIITFPLHPYTKVVFSGVLDSPWIYWRFFSLPFKRLWNSSPLPPPVTQIQSKGFWEGCGVGDGEKKKWSENGEKNSTPPVDKWTKTTLQIVVYNPLPFFNPIIARHPDPFSSDHHPPRHLNWVNTERENRQRLWFLPRSFFFTFFSLPPWPP